MSDLKYKMRLRIYREDLVFGPGVARLMELVDEMGSLSEACRKMEMAYSKGWKIIKRAENDMGVLLMQGTRGGSNGGQMKLTEQGADLLSRYQKFEQSVQTVADEMFQKYMLEDNEWI